ncbi:PAX-interacting protein 1-like isoform X2 [Neocloeon triangulifer]|uniref:PAX-interacting protein 1-like isoform X2 n=1 Tax=Neocloeon triangulifer TaxID=2078957 RepID=UPI00286F0C2A|nr:PAX-interacting protein 1-like isoform X2 [Neocloeon triangulifer]
MKITDDFESIELTEPIFKDVKYFVTGKLPQKVTSLLNDGGAKKTNYLSEIVTLCIAGEDFNESEIAEAKDIYEIQSVTWKWVILSARCGTLLPVKGFLAETTQLFSEVVACVSSLSSEDNNALWAMLNFYGGEMVTKLSKSCTHLIVSRPTGAKYEKAVQEKEKGQKIEIVTPDWIIESVKSKSRCDESLFHPSLLILPEDKKASDGLSSSIADITGFAEPEATEECTTPTAKPAPPVLDPNRYERLMEMLDQRKQQEQQVNAAQQQLSNIQLQQQQLLQQQKQAQKMQQQTPIQNLEALQQQQQQQQQPVVQRPPMAQQPQVMQQQQPQIPQQPQQMQPGMIPQQQQQRFQFQQQQYQQRMQQGSIIQGQQGPRIMLTQQQLQQRAMQGSMQFRAPRYIIADGKQYVINSAQQAQQVANLVQGVQGAVQMQDQQQQPMQTQMQGQQNVQAVQPQQQQQHFVNAPQIQQGNVAAGQNWQQGQPQQQFQMQQQGPPQQQQFQMQQMQVNQQQQMAMQQQQQQQPQQVGGGMQMNQGVQQVVNQLQGQAGQMQPQQGQMQGQGTPIQGQHPIQNQMQSQIVPVQGQIGPQIQGQVGQIQGQVNQIQGQMQGQQNQQQQTAPQRLLWQQTTPQGHRQYFQLDPQTHQQLQAMDPAQRQIFIQKLQKRQQLIQMQQQQARLQQQQQAGGIAIQGATRQPLTPQQQAALRQQFQQQQQRLGLSPQWREAIPNQQGPRTVLIQGQQQIVVQRPQQPMAISSPQATPTPVQQQHWTPGTPGAPQQPAGVGAPVQTVQTAGIQTPGTAIIQGATLPQDEAQRQLLLQRQQQLRRLQLMKQQQLQAQAQAGQVVQGQVVQGQVVQGVQGGQVVQGPRMGTPPFAVAQGVVPGQVPQQVVAAQQATTPGEDGASSNSAPTTPQPATADGQVGTPTPPQQQQAQFQQLLVNAKTKTALANMLSSRLQSGGAGEATPASVQLRLMTQQHQQQQRPPQPGVAGQPVAMAPQQIQQQPVAAGVGVGVNNQNQQQFLLTYPPRGRGAAGPNQPTQVLVRNAQGIVQYTSTRVLALNQQGAANVQPEGSQTPTPGPQPTIQIQFYGHSPNMKVPPNLCLLGCVFMTSEYAAMYSNEELEAWRNQIVNHGGEVENFYSTRVTHVLCPHQRSALATLAAREGKRLVSAFWLNDVLLKQRMLAPWQALHLPLAYNEDTRPLKKFIITSSGFTAEEKERIKYIVTTLGGRYTPYLTKENKILICRKAEGKKYNQARQWRTTIVNAHWLHEIMLGQFRALHASGYAKYQQFNDNPLGLDYSIVPHLMLAWKVPVPISPESLERGKLLQQQHIASGQLNNPKKRPAPIPIEQANKMDRPGSKILKMEELQLPNENGELHQPPPAPEQNSADKVFFQLSYVTKREELQKQAEELGGVLTKDYDKLTHLVMRDAERTEKLLCAVSKAKYIVNEKWLSESAAQQKFLDPDPYIFSNTNLEQHYNFGFKELMKKPNRDQLFKDRVFYISPGCTPVVHVIEDIIMCAGGQVEKKRRPVAHVVEMNKANPNSYIILSDSNDLHLVVDYINANIDIFSVEMVYSSIFKQSLDLTDQHKIVLR